MKKWLPVISWCFYDFANSAFTTLVVTFIFATYFTQAIAPENGTTYWSIGATVSAIIIALTSPFLGALADRGGYRRRYIIIFTLIAIVFTAALYFVMPGEVVLALTLFIIANTTYEIAGVFYNAFLPEISPANRIGRISGYGWAMGYVGGLLAMFVAMAALINPETPWFGISKEGDQHIRATNLLVAGWFLLFSLPMFLWVREKRVTPTAPPGQILSAGYQQLKQSFKEVRKYREVVKFLLARLVYNDGLITVYAFGGIYAAGTFGFTMEEIMIFGVVLNITAGIGAFALGFLDDYLGGKRTIQISLMGLILASFIAVLSPHKIGLWIAGILVGIFGGPNQSASRSLLGRFTPADKENEFYGFYAFSGKATAFLGPLMLGQLTYWTGSQRIGYSIVILNFLLGSIILHYVNEEEGKEVARQETEKNLLKGAPMS